MTKCKYCGLSKSEVVTKEQAIGYINQLEKELKNEDLRGLRSWEQKVTGIAATIEFLKVVFNLNPKSEVER